MALYWNSLATCAVLACWLGTLGLFVGCDRNQAEKDGTPIGSQHTPSTDLNEHHRQRHHASDSPSGGRRIAMPKLETDLDLIGTWQPILLNDAGKRFITEEEFQDWDSKCTFTDKTIIWKSGVRQNISVLSYQLDQTKKPHWIDWVEEGRSEKGILVIEGDLLKICIGTNRPLDFDPAGSPTENLFVFRRTDADPVDAESADSVQLETALANFKKAAIDNDQAAIEQAILQYQNVKSSEKTDKFAQLLEHADSKVRVQTIRFFKRPDPGYGKVIIPDQVMVRMLTMLDNEKVAVVVKREIVTTLLQGYEDDRKPLYERLQKMGAGGQFAVPALASFISDKDHRHWSAGGEFDAPSGAVELLGAWGSAASEAVPDLIIALDHPNKWDFAPAVATALGAIGPKAKLAIPALRRCSASQDSTLRDAASKSLEQISGKDGND